MWFLNSLYRIFQTLLAKIRGWIWLSLNQPSWKVTICKGSEIPTNFVGVQIQDYQRTLRPVSQHYQAIQPFISSDKILLYKLKCGLAMVYMIATSISLGIMRNLITSPQALSDHWRYVVSLVFRKHLFLKTNQTRAGNFNCTSTYSSSLSHATPHTVVHFYIHTARKTDGELDSLTVLLSWKENKNHPRRDSNPARTESKYLQASFYRLRQLSHKPLTFVV